MNKIVIIILCLLSLGIYFNSLNNGFIFDDKALILNNPFIKSSNFPAVIFKKDIYGHWIGQASYSLMYRPLQILTYWLDYKIWGLNPFGFHLTNLILHLLNGILIYLLLLKLFSDVRLSAVAAALFIAHPLNLAVVSYISGRADSLSLLFMLLSLLFFLKDFYALSLLSSVFALLSRENALTLCFFIALVIMVQKKEKKNYILLLPFILLGLLYAGFRFVLFGFSGLAVHGQGMVLSGYLLNCANLALQYVSLILFPFNLHFFRTTPFISGLFNLKAIFIILIGLYALLLLWKLRKDKIFVFGSLWFLSGLIPAFMMFDGFRKFKQALIAESWVYQAAIGFFLILSFCLLKLKKAGLLICACLVLYFGALTIYNNSTWKDAVSFDKNTLKYFPDDNPFRRILIDDYLDSGFYNEALSEINKLSAYYGEDNLLVIIERGNYYFFTKNAQKAIECYNKVLVKSFLTLYRTAACYKILNQPDKAQSFAQASFNLNPYYEPNKILLRELGNAF
ncbi:MAG: hypothetical protein WC417_02145 [Candidatus Omnitrophota bacterium]|jgi:tetratricopeptide (TPR) repeat protein